MRWILAILAGASVVANAAPDAVGTLATDRASAQAAARDGRCEVSREIGARVQARDPAYYQRVFVADPVIAACLATGNVAAPVVGPATEACSAIRASRPSPPTRATRSRSPAASN